MSESKNIKLFTARGTIQALHVAAGSANLVEDLQSGAGVSGLMAGLIDQPGALANLASLAMYEGETVEHVAMLIDGQLAIGTFEWVRDLKIGNEVELVVSKSDNGPLFVHAILRTEDQLLWTPPSICHTRHGWRWHAIKLCALIVVLTWVMLGSFFLIDKEFIRSTDGWYFAIFGPLVIMIFATTMSTVGIMHLGEEAERIFQALRVPNYTRFKIKPYSVRRLHRREDPHAFRKKHIYSFSKALIDHKKRYRIDIN